MGRIDERTIGHELGKGWAATERSQVHAIDEIARLLEFAFDEEGRRDIDAAIVNAASIRSASGDLVGPIIQSTLIGFAIEKVAVVLADEELRVVYPVRNHARVVQLGALKRRYRRSRTVNASHDQHISVKE